LIELHLGPISTEQFGALARLKTVKYIDVDYAGLSDAESFSGGDANREVNHAAVQ
jgi:hypothetical protein